MIKDTQNCNAQCLSNANASCFPQVRDRRLSQIAITGASPGRWVGNLVQGMNQAEMKAAPENPTATEKAALMPAMYAWRTPGRTSGGNTLCSSEAPVRMTRPELTLGAVFGSSWSSRLTNADWPDEVLKAPPIVWKTVRRIGSTRDLATCP